MEIVKTNIIQNADDSLTIVSEQDTDAIKSLIVGNDKLKFNNRNTAYKGDSEFKHRVARIPLILVERMMREGVWGNQERMREWLNNPENSPFRTTKGKL
jgi:hypothetical protein